MALVAGGVAYAQVLVLQQPFPFLIQQALLPDDVERRCQTVAYGADDLAVPDGIGRIDEDTAEHLHVDAAVEHLDQSVVRQPRVRLEKHQRNFTFGRKHGFVALWVLLRKM